RGVRRTGDRERRERTAIVRHRLGMCKAERRPLGGSCRVPRRGLGVHWSRPREVMRELGKPEIDLADAKSLEGIADRGMEIVPLARRELVVDRLSEQI